MYVDIDDVEIDLADHLMCLEEMSMSLSDICDLLNTVQKIIHSETDIRQEYLERVFKDLKQTVDESSETA